MTRKRFRLRGKPVKPVRKKNVKYTHYLWEGGPLSEVEEWAKAYGADLHDVEIEKEWGYYDEVSVMAVIRVDELKEDYDRRCSYYRTRKVAYDKWYKENKEIIKEELRLRKKEAAEEAKRKKEKEKIRLEKELKKLNRKLKKIK
jgi:hypothetical protein